MGLFYLPALHLPPIQAKRDINAVYSMGLFEDVNIVPKESEGSSETCPKVQGGGVRGGVR